MIRLSRAQVREVDRIAIEEYGMPGIVLMENAARSAVDAIVHRYGSPAGKEIAIVCGNGNNGGDGYAIARHLHNLSAHVELIDDGPPDKSGDASINRAIAKQMGIAVSSISDAEHVCGRMSLVIDAVFGTGLNRPPRPPWDQLIRRLRDVEVPLVAIDLPSGLDCDTGEPLSGLCVKADLTVTFVAEKLGFANPKSKHYTGDVVVGDIGCPREIIDRVRKL